MRRIPVLAWVLIAVGVVFVVLATIYLTTTAPDLPSFIPGHVENVARERKYSKRGLASFAVALVAFAAAAYTTWLKVKPARSSSVSSAEPSV